MRYAYVGCRTTKERNARGEGLKTYEIQPDGSWKCLQCLETEPNPSFQTLDGEGKYLYSVHGDITKVSSYRILKDHTLEHINTIDIAHPKGANSGARYRPTPASRLPDNAPLDSSPNPPCSQPKLAANHTATEASSKKDRNTVLNCRLTNDRTIK